MDLGIRGRRALVGGASGGLGRAIAERLAAEGCALTLTARRIDSLEAVAADLRGQHGAEVAVLTSDMADPAGPAQLAAGAIEAMGGVDILVLNAGGPPPVDVTATDADGWRHAFQLLAISPIDLATRLLPAMRQRRWGRIVAVGSWAVRQPEADLAYSNAGRSALVAWLKTTSRAVAADGVTVNGALPGRHATARIEQLEAAAAKRTGRSVDDVRAANLATIAARRYGDPADFASYVAYLCSEPAGYQTGTFTAVDGGLVIGLP